MKLSLKIVIDSDDLRVCELTHSTCQAVPYAPDRSSTPSLW
jgi:hypothetical protein